MTFILPGGIGIIKPGTGTISVWDATSVWTYNSGGTVALSNGNKTATNTGPKNGVGGIKGLKSNTTGKLYFEIVANVIDVSGYTFLGFVNDVFVGSTDILPGNTTNGWSMTPQPGSYWQPYNNAMGSTNTSASAAGNGDVLGFHVDITNRFVYMSVNGVYILGNPGSQANAIYANMTGTTFWPAISVSYDGAVHSQATLRTVAPFGYTPYTGYSAWG